MARDILFEIGTEELPSAPLDKALAQFSDLVQKKFAEHHITYTSFSVYSTPRRIALYMKEVIEQQDDSVKEYKGPAKNLAFDEQGNPSPAACGFARSKGVDVGDLKTQLVDGVEYVFASVAKKGVKTSDVLPELLGKLITSLDWKRSQRWGSGDERFARPVRWIVALFGNEIVPVTFGHLKASNVSQGYRYLDERDVVIAEPNEYKKALEKRYVIVSQEERKQRILDGIKAQAAPFGTPLINESVLREVINLTEWPSVLVGTFDEEFLRVPREILEYAMSKHQRYFAIERTDDTLDNHFLLVSNGDDAFNQQIIEGHERVIRARLADAAFFYDEDRKVSLDTWLAKLDHVVFQEKLGTTAYKVQRIEKNAAFLADALNVSEQQKRDIARAAHLAKADLVTNAVVEFTEVQGIMGGYYATCQGENETVAQAISQHYQPCFASDAIPGTLEGQIIAVADKIDTISGIFAVGKAPKGTSDPFALRRSAIGVLQIALKGFSLNLDELIAQSLSTLDKISFDENAIGQEVKAFFIARLEAMLKDAGISSEVQHAVLAVSNTVPQDIFSRCEALQSSLSAGTEITSLSAAYKRANNLRDKDAGTLINESLLGDLERAFLDALRNAHNDIVSLMEEQKYEELIARYAQLKEPVDAFFEGVMIMDDDQALRANRLALLNVFVDEFALFADFGALA